MEQGEGVNIHREQTTALPPGFIWQVEAFVQGRPAVCRELIVAERVSPVGHVLAAFEREGGATRWENAEAGGREMVPATLVLSRDGVLCNNGRGGVLALDPADGHILWSFAGFSELNYQSDLIVDGGLIFFAAGGKLHAFEADSKRAVGEVEILPDQKIAENQDGILSVCADGDNIYLTCFSSVVAVRKKALQILWKHAPGEDVYFGNQRRVPAFFGDFVILAGEDFQKSPSECFTVLCRETGEEIWSISPPSGLGSFNPTVVEGGLLHGYALSLLDLEQRQIFWTAEVEAVLADPLLIGDHIYVAAQNGSIFCVDKRSGACREVLSLPGACRGLPRGSELLS